MSTRRRVRERHARARSGRLLLSLFLAALAGAACAPAAPSPMALPKATEAPKPAATATPARPTEAPKPAAKPTEAPKPAEKPTAALAFDEKAVADFYRGKTVKIVVGSSPGGLPDTNARLLARHMPRYLPGSPTVIVENKPGAGGFLAANAVYNTEPKDGTVLNIFFGTIVLQQALGAEGIQFDAARYQWLGSIARTYAACAVRTDTGVTSLQQLADGQEVVLGTTGPGTTLHDTPSVLNAALGTRFKLVPGYPGINEIVLAIEKKEVDGFCAGFDPMLAAAGRLLEGGSPTLKVLVVMGSETPDHPLLKGVPAAETLARTPQARQMLRLVAAPNQFTNAFAVAPGVPADRVAALRRALARTFADEQFLAEARQARLPVNPLSAEELSRGIAEVLSTPPDVLASLKAVLR